MGYIVRFIIGKCKPDKLYEEEIYYYNHKKDAVDHFNSFKEDDSDLYKRIDLIQLSKSGDLVLDSIDYEIDWRKWKLGDNVEFIWKDFDGSGSVEGIITKVEEDHLIMTTSDNMDLWVDDNASGVFVKLWQNLCNLLNYNNSGGSDPGRPVVL